MDERRGAGRARIWAVQRGARVDLVCDPAGGSRGRPWRMLVALAAALACSIASAAPAFANAPNPTSVSVSGYTVHGSEVTVTVSGTWTWNVPNGAQRDCNDSRIGVGYAVSWGDNTANPLKQQHNEPIIYVGTATDDWVHSVTEGKQTVAGPFKKGPVTLEEAMLGETPEAAADGFGPQGISTGASEAIPTKQDAERWVSNCGPTAQSVVNGVTIGNSEPGEPTKGFPNGTWGPISHTYTTPGPYKICPVMYDPHGSEVGGNAGNANQITAGGNNDNNDNSIESNGNTSECTVTATLPKLATTAEPSSAASGQSLRDAASIEGNDPQGSLIWKLYGPFSSSAAIKESSCVGTPAFDGTASPVAVTGNATYKSPSATVSVPGTYQWVASYISSNLANNLSVGPFGCGSIGEQVTIAPHPAFSIEKQQEIDGSGKGFTKEPLTSALGATVDYQIVVTNTGNVPLKFSNLTDANCTNLAGGPGNSEVAPSKSATYTCNHVLTAPGQYVNEASVEGSPPPEEGFPVTQTSNKVVVFVENPIFSIVKEQKLAGEEHFTTKELSGKPGETVDYLLTVKNEGNVTEKFGALVDAKCSGISPAGATELAAGKSETFTCEHELVASNAPTYENKASITGNGETKTSNPVVVKVVIQQFSIVKEQKLAGQSSYTRELLKGKVGETVEYKVTVKNEGNVKLKFGALKDPKCTNVAPSGETEVEAGKSESFTCEHVLSKADLEANGGIYENVALIKGGEKEQESPPVKTKVEEERFSIVKEQKLASEEHFTTKELSGKPGETVDYLVTVTNEGNVTEKFGPLVDAKCSSISPSGATELAAGKHETFTCEHELVAGNAPKYENTASITGNGEPETSNPVFVKVEILKFSIVKEQKLASEEHFTTTLLKGKVGDTIDYLVTVTNEGNVKLKFGALKDPKCVNIAPAGATVLEPAESESFTCEHELTGADAEAGVYENAALIKGGEKEEESPPVKTKVEREGFSIVKEQKLAGEEHFTTRELKGEVGQTVDYMITVKNLGTVTEKFGALVDPKCSNIQPTLGLTELKPGEQEVFTCEHRLAATDTVYVNVATITGNGTEKPSDKVVVEVEHPSFTIIKMQEIAATETGFTTRTLLGRMGQTIDYEVVVKNTGNVPLSFSELTDARCEGISPTGRGPVLNPEQTATYSCYHVIVGEGDWVNDATITGTDPKQQTITHTSNQVVVYDPSFTIEKLQRIAGTALYSPFELTAEVGQTVQYEIIVTNGQEQPLTFVGFSDPHCENIGGGPGTTELSDGQSTTYLCEHVLTTAGLYTNEASVEGLPSAGRKTSNRVTVNVVPPKEIVKAGCALSEPAIVLYGASGARRKAFTVHIGALGIKEIAFYIDGHKVRTFVASEAQSGEFRLKVNPGKLSYGAHTVTAKAVMTDSACAPLARASVFVHPRPAKLKPKFTG